MIEYISGIDGDIYVVLERSIITCVEEDVGACVLVPTKEDVRERIVIVIT